jgi:DNA-binding NarL/FixJ family response regulator
VSVRVLVVDDQELVRSGFRLILSSAEGVEVVGEASDGAHALSAARSLRPDVVLMDVRMPHVDGITATRAITDELPGTRVLVLTTFDLDEHVYEALQAGAAGFLLKDVPMEDLVGAVRAVHAGASLLSPSVTRRLVEEYAARRACASPPPAATALTTREHEVLLLLARGLSNAEIADGLVVTEATVKTHVTAVLAKLGLRSRVQAVVYAYESGLVRAGSG